MSHTSSNIPIVDFAEWRADNKPEARQKIAQEIASACKNVGFVYITNHGVTPDVLDEAFAWSKKFFNLSEEEKLKAPHPEGTSIIRGYSPPGYEKVSQVIIDKHDPEVEKKLREVTDCKVI